MLALFTCIVAPDGTASPQPGKDVHIILKHRTFETTGIMANVDPTLET